MTTEEIMAMLVDAGFTTGWSLVGNELALWEHEQDPPAPLTRPEATDETPTAN
jgi:hypothetical protein